MGKKAIFSYLSVPPILPFIPSPALLTLPFLCFLFCLLSLPNPFLLCMLRLIVWTPNALMAFSQRAQISAALEENGARWQQRWWGHFKGCFLMPLMHPHPHPVFYPYSPPPSTHPLMLQSSQVLWWDVTTEDGGGETINRESILSGEMLQCDKAEQCLQTAGQITAALWLEHSCGKDTPDRANGDSCKHMVFYVKRTTKKNLILGIFLKNGWINLPVETR